MNNFKTTEFDTQSDVQEEVVVPPTETRTDSYTDDGQESFGNPQNLSQDDETDIGEDAENSDSDGAGQNSPVQTREENSAIRAARIRATREAEKAAAEKADREIAASGVINPLTKKPFKNMAEFREYGEKYRRAEIEERAKKEGRSVEELEEEDLNRRFITSLRKKEEETNTKRADTKSFIENDVLDFVEKFPEFDTAEKLSQLENNKSFREFCGTRFGREPLAELYASYVSIVGRAENAAIAKNTSRTARSTGSGGEGGASLTPGQKKTLDEWNAANPDMQMTPKEFLSR